MSSPLPLSSGLQPVVTGEPERHDLDLQDIGGIDLRTLNVTAAVGFGLRVGLDAITQVLRGVPGPLGERDR